MIAFLVLSKQSFASTTSSLLPSSDGAYTQWTPNSGTVHFNRVDEASCNGNTDFNRETTVGQRDSYGIALSSIPNGATITQIAITPCASKNTSGGSNTTFDVFYRLNGVNSADMPGYTLTTTTPAVLSATNYTGLSVAKNGTTTLEIGGVYTAGNRGVKLSQISVVITYTIPPSVTTSAATNAAQTTATLNSTVNPNGLSTTANYRYGTSNVACSSLPTVTSNTNMGAGTSGVTNPQGIASLSANTTYYFCATATNNDGTKYGNVLSFTTTPNAPNPPSGLEVTPDSSTTAILVWVDNSSTESGFRIERSLDGSTGWTQIGSTSANITTFTDNGLMIQQPYYYRVYAVNVGGNSSYSNVYSINTGIPNNPSHLTVTTATCGAGDVPADLSWQDNAFNEDSFDIEYAADEVNYSPVSSVSSNVTTFHDTSSSCAYRVRSVNTLGSSDWAYVEFIN
jgi:hypothetical protein